MKNKNKLAPLFCLVFILFTSCSAIPGYSEPEDQAIVSSIGFDLDGGAISVTVEISMEGGKEKRTLTGRGESIEEAISYIAAREPLSLEISHMSIIALGEGMDGEHFHEILDFLERGGSLSPSARLISVSNAKTLLEDPEASGFELSGMLSDGREDSSLGAQSRLYKVRGAMLEGDGVLAIPHFFADGDSFELYGIRVYRGGEGLTILDREEGAYYMMMRGLYDSGLFSGDATGLMGSVGVSRCRTEYTLTSGEEGATLTVTLLIYIDSEIADQVHSGSIAEATARNAEALYQRLYSYHGDLFGFDRIAMRHGIDPTDMKVEFKCEARG